MTGLTAAVYLLRAGYRVTVYEQSHEIGGVTATLWWKGFGCSETGESKTKRRGGRPPV